jgi:hypothetical protein
MLAAKPAAVASCGQHCEQATVTAAVDANAWLHSWPHWYAVWRCYAAKHVTMHMGQTVDGNIVLCMPMGLHGLAGRTSGAVFASSVALISLSTPAFALLPASCFTERLIAMHRRCLNARGVQLLRVCRCCSWWTSRCILCNMAAATMSCCTLMGLIQRNYTVPAASCTSCSLHSHRHACRLC